MGSTDSNAHFCPQISDVLPSDRPYGFFNNLSEIAVREYSLGKCVNRRDPGNSSCILYGHPPLYFKWLFF